MAATDHLVIGAGPHSIRMAWRTHYVGHLRAVALGFVWLRDRWEDVTRSIVQLVLGSYMVWDARRLALCTRHFEAVGDIERKLRGAGT
jgi:hypothetical protein